jgi:hypothetical protein
MSERDGVLRSSSREKFARLRSTLQERRSEDADQLLAEYDDCGRKWKGTYRCGSPGCPSCRRLLGNAEKLRVEGAGVGGQK